MSDHTEHEHHEPPPNPFAGLLDLKTLLTLLITAFPAVGTGYVLNDHVKQLEAWRDKHEAVHVEQAKQLVDLDKRATVGEAQQVAILEALHRLESKIDHLARDK